MPDDPYLRTVFPDPAGAAEAFWRKHGFVLVNHLLMVRDGLARERPEEMAGLVRVFLAASARTGRDGLRPVLALAIRYAYERGLLPRPLPLDEAWEGSTPDLA